MAENAMDDLSQGEKDISATPAVAYGVVYFPSWNGYLYAVNAFNGALIWKQNLGQLTGLTGTGVLANVTVSRSTSTIDGDLLIGVLCRNIIPGGGITTRAMLHFQRQCRKASSPNQGNPMEDLLLPDNGGRPGGYAGAAVWGSSPAIDVNRRLVYVATGNLYTAPAEVLKCQEQQNNQTAKPSHPDQCIGPDINYNSILAIDIDSGRISWSRQLGGYDIFYFACLVPNNPDCPPGPNLDADFGEAPMLLTINSNGTIRDVAVAVQKSGFAWALDRDNGDIVWFNLAGPGGKEGGGQWGAATDGRGVYTNIANSDRQSFMLTPSNQTTTAGAWVALDANTGEIVWSTANPSNDTAQGPVTVANGVLFAGSVASNGPIYAIDTGTGNILWTYNTGAMVYGGISASYGCIYVGNGYTVGWQGFTPLGLQELHFTHFALATG
ncbi:Uncharacterized protein TCM_011786 [Theobroma cacao]|uniref:Pyrrolo-quinoline quinone repeat domain-containing protein n=1 Tax=Theobroma cacao TaxID=3641 RepID=A0A061EAR2_THECC|nr:Uncharacterized protein TCM_011786 [Theobroma cacao]